MILIKEHRYGKLIILSNQIDTRTKKLDLCYCVLFLIAGTLFLRVLLLDTSSVISIFFMLLVVICMYIVSFRFANKASLSEKMFVSKDYITLSKQGLFTTTKNTFNTSKISDFRHLAIPILESHQLNGSTFDYLGFDTEQKVINDMYGDNRLAFSYESKTITFGNNIYVWEYDSIKSSLRELCGKDFSKSK